MAGSLSGIISTVTLQRLPCWAKADPGSVAELQRERGRRLNPARDDRFAPYRLQFREKGEPKCDGNACAAPAATGNIYELQEDGAKVAFLTYATGWQVATAPLDIRLRLK
jgi:hypothetical protein